MVDPVGASRLTALFVAASIAFSGSSSAQEVARADAPGLASLARGRAIGQPLFVEGLALEGGDVVDLALERFEPFAEDATVTVHGDGGKSFVVERPKNAYFRGTVSGDVGGTAFLSVRESGVVNGIVADVDGTWVIRGGPSGLAALDAPPRDFQCGNVDHDLRPPARAAAEATTSVTPLQATSILYTAKVAFETDFEFFQLFGNAADATSYVGELVGAMSSIYQAEVGTKIQVGSLSLWQTAADPWTQSTSACELYEFGRFWNQNRTGVSRSTAHMLSGRNLGGGIAYLGVLCGGPFPVDHGGSCPGLSPNSDLYGGAYGVTGNLNGAFDPANPIGFDIYGPSHEIGHNFGANHTHCFAGTGGNPSDVDHCYGSENFCYSGPVALPGPGSTSGGSPGNKNGTIMSYCHIFPLGLGGGGDTNITLTFGKGHPFGVAPGRVPGVMRTLVEQQARANPTCLAAQPSCRGIPATTIGDDGPNTLIGGPGTDVILGLGGNDVIHGGGGVDVICAGDGDDKIFGDDGDDRLFGQGGNDVIRGGPGNDRLVGGDGNDTILGQGDDDTLIGQGGIDRLDGGPGVDTCTSPGDILNGCP